MTRSIVNFTVRLVVAIAAGCGMLAFMLAYTAAAAAEMLLDPAFGYATVLLPIYVGACAFAGRVLGAGR